LLGTVTGALGADCPSGGIGCRGGRSSEVTPPA
jgi:hypothetical protein